MWCDAPRRCKIVHGQLAAISNGTPVASARPAEQPPHPHAAAGERRIALQREFRRLKIDALDIATGASFVEPLRKFFHKRGQRR